MGVEWEGGCGVEEAGLVLSSQPLRGSNRTRWHRECLLMATRFHLPVSLPYGRRPWRFKSKGWRALSLCSRVSSYLGDNKNTHALGVHR